jgi:hypothetical protein
MYRALLAYPHGSLHKRHFVYCVRVNPWDKTFHTQRDIRNITILHTDYMFRLYLSHLQALKGQIHTVSEQCIVGSPTITIIRLHTIGLL